MTVIAAQEKLVATRAGDTVRKDKENRGEKSPSFWPEMTMRT